MATIKKRRKWQVFSKVWRYWNPYSWLVGMSNGTATVENGLVVPQQVNHETIT
jgi:hypothetical protein